MIVLALVEGAALAVPAILQPGPLQAFYLSRSVAHGWRRTLPAAFAPVLTDGPIVAVVLLALTQFPPGMLRGVQGVGGLFLLFLAWRAWRDARVAVGVDPDPNAAARGLRDAVALNFLNPLPYIFWSTVAGPILLDAWRASPSAAVAFVVGLYGTFVAGLAAMIVIFASLGRMGARTARTLGRVAAVALGTFGVVQVVRSILG